VVYVFFAPEMSRILTNYVKLFARHRD
jgi:hypothetical protein